MTGKIILLGDSIFDNAAYVIGQLCVTEQLQEIAPPGVEVGMLAVDGDVVANVADQLARVPEPATHLFVSAGGNDALRCYQALTDSYQSSNEFLQNWAEIQSEFRAAYQEMLQLVIGTERHVTVCTVYDSVPDLEEIAFTALSLFNDVIVCEAVRFGLPIIDLRRVCSEPDDYSHLSPIEPSFDGGAKIAKSMLRVFEEHDFTRSTSVIYT